jgi:hypothetical protein
MKSGRLAFVEPDLIAKTRFCRALTGVVIFVVCLLTTGAPAYGGGEKETCNESTVRRKAQLPAWQIAADNIYINSTNSRKPLIGKEQLDEQRKVNLTERKNQMPTRFFPEHIAASKSADMAYEYGKAHVEYELANTGQHISYDFEYLRVWRATAGVCRLEASFSRAERLSGMDK